MTANLMCNEFPDTVGHDSRYFEDRHCIIDCRGPLTISRESYWGYFVTVITESHSISDWDITGFQSVTLGRPVIVERKAWIGSRALLYNCHIHEGAIVAAGAVVRSQEVRPYVMVAGNPAKVIARYLDGQWQYLAPKWEVLA